MRKLLLIICALSLTACGYSSRDNELIGQVKKVVKNTPIICDDFDSVDASMGVMRGGVGSMSTEDVWMYVEDPAQLDILKKANESGALVKITYNVKRFTFCVKDHFVTKVELVK